MAEALLPTERPSFSRHGTVIAEYGRLFAKTERMDRRFHRLLQRTFVARHPADYDTDVDLNSDEVGERLGEGGAFLDAAKDYLKESDEDNRIEDE